MSATYPPTETDPVAEADLATHEAKDRSDNVHGLDTELDAVDTALAGKVPTSRTVAGHALSSDVTISKGDVGLGNVDNTSDADKPVSTATQTALDAKLAKASNLSDVVSAVTARSNLGGVLTATTGTHSARLAASHVANRLWKETDTGLIYLDDGVNWIIFKGDGHVTKTADETVNNSATLQDDDHLLFPIEVNEVWHVEALLRCAGSSLNADIKFQWTGPTGASAAWTAAEGNVALGSDPGGVLTLANTQALGLRSGESPFVHLAGWFFADASHAGNIRLQWAQNSAQSENTTIKANSFLRLRRLA